MLSPFPTVIQGNHTCWSIARPYQNGRKLADVQIDEINAYRDLPDCFIWVALKEPGLGDSSRTMSQQFGLHELASRTRSTAISGRRSRSTAIRSSRCSIPSEFDDEGELLVGEINVFVGKNYDCSKYATGRRTGFRGCQVALRARAASAQARSCVRDRHAPLDNIITATFPCGRRSPAELDEVEERIFERSAARRRARGDRRPVLAQAPARAAPAPHRAASGSRQQTCSWRQVRPACAQPCRTISATCTITCSAS